MLFLLKLILTRETYLVMKKKNLFLIALAAFSLCLSGCSLNDVIHTDDDGNPIEPVIDLNNLPEIQEVYKLYVDNGGTMTYEEWLAAIKGGKGDKGDKGDTGEAGPQCEQGPAGQDGEDGLTPFIGENGNWWIGDKDTGVKAAGQDGKDGQDGQNGQDGAAGKDGVDDKNGLLVWQAFFVII